MRCEQCRQYNYMYICVQIKELQAKTNANVSEAIAKVFFFIFLTLKSRNITGLLLFNKKVSGHLMRPGSSM